MVVGQGNDGDLTQDGKQVKLLYSSENDRVSPLWSPSWIPSSLRDSAYPASQKHVGRDLSKDRGPRRFFALSNLAGAPDDVPRAAQLLQPHGAPGVELLSGDAHLAAQAELSPRR